MPADDLNIKKIALDDNKTSVPSENSVLIPKIGLTESSPPGGVSNPEQSTHMPDPNSENPRKLKTNKKVIKILSVVFGVLLVIILATGIPAFLTYRSGMKLYKSAQTLKDAAKSQDLVKIKSQIEVTKKDLAAFKRSYLLLSWTRVIPYFGGFVSDLGHAINAAVAGMDSGVTVVNAIEPYSDLLGLKGASGAQSGVPKDGAQTAQDRINFIVQSLPGLIPQIDKISEQMKTVEKEMSKINAERYPVNFKGMKVRENIKMAQELTTQTTTLLVKGKPVIQNAPYLLGMESPRTYLLLFQNDKELRPTGGFMTGYAIMSVDKAKFNPTLSDDIYNLDAKYKPSVPAPEPIVKYLKGPYVLSPNLRLRDMNWSPDFPTGMEMVTKAIQEVGVKNIDGIIAVDTQVLESLLKVIGPIGVPGFGNFTTEIDPECNCSQVIHALEQYADVEGPIIWDPVTGKIIQRPPNSENRKKIIGPLMNSILANAMGQPKEKLPGLFTAAFNSVMEKHVLLYVYNQNVQKAITDFGIGGSIKEYEGDYLHINDANLGGRKSNLYATEEVLQEVKIAGDGTVTKTVTITYKNPERHDGWLNSVLPTWVRVYVPKGSTLMAADGLQEKSEPYEELGKTVFAGYFQLRPEGVAKVTFQYKLPFKVKGQYKLFIQKQPGAKDYLYTINVGRNRQEFFLKTDKEITIGL
jgi:hypothetical protein